MTPGTPTGGVAVAQADGATWARAGHETTVASVREELERSAGGGVPGIVAVVVTWNSADHIGRCVESVLDSTVPVAVLVVDNSSSDDTVDTVSRRFGRRVSVVSTGGNRGYAGGNNVGLAIARHAGADVAVLLNPDATVDQRCLATLAQSLSDPAVGMVSPAICYAGSDRIWYAGADFDPVTCATYHRHEGEAYTSLTEEPCETARASGCVLGVRLDVVDRVGPLDERYFLYYEETEWSLRVRAAGRRILVVPSARAWHDTGHGRGGATPSYQYYMTRNRLLLARDHGRRGARGAATGSVRDTVVTLVSLARRDRTSWWPCARSTARGYLDFVGGHVGRRR